MIRVAGLAMGGFLFATAGVLAQTGQAPNPVPPVPQTAPGHGSPATEGRGQATDGGKTQPQGPTGQTDTSSGGAPAASPQGDTPSGMQPDPGKPDAR